MLSKIRLDEGWSTLFLSLGMVMLTAYGIIQAELTDGLELLLYVSFFAYLSGLFLAKSTFSPRVVTLFSFVYAAFVISYLLGTYFYPETASWSERISDLMSRQSVWLSKAFSGKDKP